MTWRCRHRFHPLHISRSWVTQPHLAARGRGWMEPPVFLVVICYFCCCLVANLCLTLCDPMYWRDPMHHRLPYPSLSPRACSNSCPLSHWCYPTISSSIAPFSSCPQSFPASRSSPMNMPKYWSFNFSISPSNEYSGLISFRIDWFNLLAVQGTLKSLL